MMKFKVSGKTSRRQGNAGVRPQGRNGAEAEKDHLEGENLDEICS